MKKNKDSHPWTGRTIGRFSFERELGRGACAVVFLVRDTRSGGSYAAKVLYDELCRDPEFVDSFVKEARHAMKLKHPNILRVYSVAMFEDRYFMITDFAKRGTVQDMLSDGNRIALKESLRIAIQAAEALQFAEKEGIVHRDVKPANLLIMEDGSVRIADLGIADRTGGDVSDSEDIYGSPHYISPEQATGKPATSQSDIYSLGATLYHMLTGRTPFSASGRRGLIIKHLNEKPVPVNRLFPLLPKKVGETVELMMAKDPGNRFQNFAQVISALTTLEELKPLNKLKLSRRQRKER